MKKLFTILCVAFLLNLFCVKDVTSAPIDAVYPIPTATYPEPIYGLGSDNIPFKIKNNTSYYFTGNVTVEFYYQPHCGHPLKFKTLVGSKTVFIFNLAPSSSSSTFYGNISMPTTLPPDHYYIAMYPISSAGLCEEGSFCGPLKFCLITKSGTICEGSGSKLYQTFTENFNFSNQKDELLNKYNEQKLKIKSNTPQSASMLSVDTLLPKMFALDCFAPTLYNSSNGGYVVGTNGYSDQEKAQRFDGCDISSISGVGFWIGGKTVGANDSIHAKVYSVTVAGAPGTLLGTSLPVAFSDIDTNFNLLDTMSFFHFASPIATSNEDFFISLEVSGGAGDTLGIVTSADPCSFNVGYSYEKWSDGTWHSLAIAWPLDLDLFVFPILNYENLSTPTAIDDTTVTSKNFGIEIEFTLNDNDCLTPGFLWNGPSDVSYVPLVVDYSTAARGTVSLQGDTIFIYTPNTEYVGKDSFTYSYIDGTMTSNTATVHITVVGVSNINDVDLSSSYTVVPVPAHDNITVRVDLKDNKAATLSIVNVLGKTVSSKIIDGNGTYTMNVSDLANGIYFVNMNDGINNGSKKIVVQH